MKTRIIHFLFPFLFLFAAGVAQAAKPNFIVIFADDQGYGDLSCFGSKTIRTPNIDGLATDGMDILWKDPEIVSRLRARMEELDAEITKNARAPWTKG